MAHFIFGVIFVLILTETVPICLLIYLIKNYKEDKQRGCFNKDDQELFEMNLFFVGLFMLAGIGIAIGANMSK